MTSLQVAAQKMRDHWYNCEYNCIPGYSHPRCEEGTKLEMEYLKHINNALEYNSETWCGWCGRFKLCREYNMNGFSVTSCKSCDDENK